MCRGGGPVDATGATTEDDDAGSGAGATMLRDAGGWAAGSSEKGATDGASLSEAATEPMDGDAPALALALAALGRPDAPATADAHERPLPPPPRALRGDGAATAPDDFRGRGTDASLEGDGGACALVGAVPPTAGNPPGWC